VDSSGSSSSQRWSSSWACWTASGSGTSSTNGPAQRGHCGTSFSREEANWAWHFAHHIRVSTSRSNLWGYSRNAPH
jgi:hypothetical protein